MRNFVGAIFLFGAIIIVLYCREQCANSRKIMNENPMTTLLSGGANLSPWSYTFTPPFTGFEYGVLGVGIIGAILLATGKAKDEDDEEDEEEEDDDPDTYNPYEPTAVSQSAMFLAVSSNNINMLNRLKMDGVDVNMREKNGQTAAHIAARYGHILALQWLKDNGADINVRDIEGRTPAHVASASVLQWLKKNGADMNVEDNDGNIPGSWR